MQRHLSDDLVIKSLLQNFSGNRLGMPAVPRHPILVSNSEGRTFDDGEEGRPSWRR